MPGHRRPDILAPSPSLSDHARAWNPPEDPGLAIDRAINRARSIRRADEEEDRRKGGPEPTVQTSCLRCGKLVLASGGQDTTHYDPVPGHGYAVHVCRTERPGVLPVAPAAPGSRTGPDALAVLCHELGLEFLALAEARRDGKSWDDGHWKRLRGAVVAAGVVLDAGPRPEGRT